MDEETFNLEVRKFLKIAKTLTKRYKTFFGIKARGFKLFYALEINYKEIIKILRKIYWYTLM